MDDSTTTPTTPNAPPPLPAVRPVAITVICVLGIIGAIFAIPLVFTDIARQIGVWYPPYLAFSAVIGGICIFGFWKMRRWAVFTYTGILRDQPDSSAFDRALECSRHSASGYRDCDWVRLLLENEMTTRLNPYAAANGGEPSRLQSARLVAAVAKLGSLGLLFI